jgi:branched-chain amino acid transport system ATP-binding protein
MIAPASHDARSPILRVEELHTYYGLRHILQGVTLEIGPSEVASLIGRNGAGKSTMLRSIIGLKKPKSGRVVFLDEDITPLAPHHVAARGIGLVPQGGGVFPDISVMENLLFSPVKRSGEWDLKRVLALFPRLDERRNQRGRTLSGGEQKMLAVARALVMNPRLLLMDEPSEALAPLFVREIGRIVQEISKMGMSVLLIEQNIPLALSSSHRCYVFNKGRVVYQATPDKLRADHDAMQQYLGV